MGASTALTAHANVSLLTVVVSQIVLPPRVTGGIRYLCRKVQHFRGGLSPIWSVTGIPAISFDTACKEPIDIHGIRILALV